MTDNTITIAAWNIAHQIREVPVPPEIIAALAALDADILVLTEYVPGPDHERVVADLQAAGYADVHMSARVERQNQVLVATRQPSNPGSFVAPNLRPQIPSNFLHVEIPKPRLDVVGLRIPMFVSGDSAGEHEYRDWIRDQVLVWARKPTVVIGDLNCDPGNPKRWQNRSLASFADKGWSVLSPEDGWSYMGRTGITTRLDHALLSPGLRALSAEYVTEVDGGVLAGKHPPAPSDHAVLVVKFRIEARLSALSTREA